MTRIRVAGFGVSLDGFAAGTEQSLDHPLGMRGPELFEWFFPTRTFRAMQGQSDGDTGRDDEFARRAMDGFGAFILGRNMFGPIRGEWPDDQWKGWWGDDPPYHAPTFVLTHHPRASIEMDGGTTFHFVTDGIDAALRRARDAAGPQGHQDRRRGRDRAPVHPRRPCRRDPSGGGARGARSGRGALRGHRSSRPWISDHRARSDRARHACRPGTLNRGASRPITWRVPGPGVQTSMVVASVSRQRAHPRVGAEAGVIGRRR